MPAAGGFVTYIQIFAAYMYSTLYWTSHAGKGTQLLLPATYLIMLLATTKCFDRAGYIHCTF